MTMTVRPDQLVRAARKDGYRPVTDALWVIGMAEGWPPVEEERLLVAAARYLDSSHLQIERAREALDYALSDQDVDGNAKSATAGRQAAEQALGDLQMGVIALDKTLDILVEQLTGRFSVRLSIPAAMLAKRPTIRRLRDSYAHIDERALGKGPWAGSPDVASRWEDIATYQSLTSRVLTDGHDTLCIDGEATTLCASARDYLLAAWVYLVERALASGRAR